MPNDATWYHKAVHNLNYLIVLSIKPGLIYLYVLDYPQLFYTFNSGVSLLIHYDLMLHESYLSNYPTIVWQIELSYLKTVPRNQKWIKWISRTIFYYRILRSYLAHSTLKPHLFNQYLWMKIICWWFHHILTRIIVGL